MTSTEDGQFSNAINKPSNFSSLAMINVSGSAFLFSYSIATLMITGTWLLCFSQRSVCPCLIFSNRVRNSALLFISDRTELPGLLKLMTM